MEFPMDIMQLNNRDVKCIENNHQILISYCIVMAKGMVSHYCPVKIYKILNDRVHVYVALAKSLVHVRVSRTFVPLSTMQTGT
jgi:hypothetical protein